MQFTTYTEIRDKIKTGDVYFTASNTVVGSAMRFFTRSKVSHCGVFKLSEGRVTMLEAQLGKGIQEVYASKVLKEEPILFIDTSYWRKKTGITDEAIKDFFERHEGEKYDTVGMLLSLFVSVSNRRLFCSEMVSNVIKIRLPHLKRNITPADVYTALSLIK